MITPYTEGITEAVHDTTKMPNYLLKKGIKRLQK